MTQTTYLITGSNRGLGFAFVTKLLARPNTTVIAGVRDPSHASSQGLSKLPVGKSSSLIVVKLESYPKESALEAVKDLQQNHGISSLDVVIANAAIAKVFPTVAAVDVEDMAEHYLVNTIGVVALFQAVLPLLSNSQKQRKFIAISSKAGSIGNMDKVPNSAYGVTKAALNYIVKKIHLEHEDIIAVPIDPGWAQTDMGNYGAALFGVEKAEITVEESISGVVKIIDEATREKTSGKFFNYTGGEASW